VVGIHLRQYHPDLSQNGLKAIVYSFNGMQEVKRNHTTVRNVLKQGLIVTEISNITFMVPFRMTEVVKITNTSEMRNYPKSGFRV